jgi:hypothetical protein
MRVKPERAWSLAFIWPLLSSVVAGVGFGGNWQGDPREDSRAAGASFMSHPQY